MRTPLQLLKLLNETTGGRRGSVDGFYGIVVADARTSHTKYNLIHVSYSGRERVVCSYYIDKMLLGTVLETIIEWEESK